MSPANANREVYRLLKNGVKVTFQGKENEEIVENVRVIDWNEPSKKDLNDFHYETHKFGGLRFFLELAIFLAVKLGANNPKSCIIFFRMCRDYLGKIENIKSCDGYKYSAAAMINLLFFVRIHK
jgi:hypothetical protein